MRKGILLLFSCLSFSLSAGEVSRFPSCEELLANDGLSAFVWINLASHLNRAPDQPALAYNQLMMSVIDHYKNPNLDFAYFESYFRKYEIPIYLVANSQPLEMGVSIGPPKLANALDNRLFLYHLWTGLNGKEEADAFKKSLQPVNDVCN
jgi:hypothetical protein